MIPLSQVAIIEKNRLESDFPWILLFEIILSDTETVRLCRNTENIEFEGNTWFAYDVQVDSFEETNENSAPELNIKIANINGMLDTYIDQYHGLTGAKIKTHILLVTDTEKSRDITIDFKVVGSSIEKDYLNLTLSGFNPLENKTPRATMRKLLCRYKEFKGDRCGYTGSETECDRTLKRCQQLGNEKNFGGAPSLGWKGVFI